MAGKYYKKYPPDPRFERADCECLYGEWDFAFADADCENPVFDKKIIVPYSYECEASGIGDTSAHGCVWYRRKFNVKRTDGAVLLKFEAVDYECSIYINGEFAGGHIGGFTGFCLDITALVGEGENEIRVKVLDSFDKSQLRGKQRARQESYECWYVQTTGIWKPVRIEYAGGVYIKKMDIAARGDGRVTVVAELSAPAPFRFCAEGERGVVCDICTGQSDKHTLQFWVEEPKLWSADSPYLYSVKAVAGEEMGDTVKSYFAFCDVRAKEDGLYINGRREYQQMILYQGYWLDSMLTAPDDISIERDIDAIKAMGFNGVRVHQKIENDIFYYLCDKKGLYVFGEIPSAYEFTERMRSEFSRDCRRIFEQLKNHVCISCWLLFNETWGVYGINEDREQQNYIEGLAAQLRGLDPRPVITNDGWYHLDSDILSLHEYEQDAEVFSREYRDKDYVVGGKIINTLGTAFAKGYRYSGQPVFISEYGGVAISGNGWGYGESAPDSGSYERRLRDIVGAVTSTPYVSGCCYTQFNDTQQEINGLLDAQRNAKLPFETIKKIFTVK